jgi:branched-chain amino acid transport system ATP-binding protein
VLEIREVSKNFGGLQVLHRVSLEVEEGEILGMIGPNGAGKTTLFNLVSGFLRPDEGEILFRGRPIHGLKPHTICKMGIARTFQVVQTFGPLSVLDAVMVAALNRFSSVRTARSLALEILERVGLRRKARASCESLTLADQKALEVAKALATGPRILLMDECMAGLTEVEALRMMELVRGLQEQGLGVIVVEHVMPIVMGLCERVLVLNFGRLIAHGTPQEVCSHPQVIESYLGSEEEMDAEGP